MNIVDLHCFKPWRNVHWNSDDLIDRLKPMNGIDLDELSPDELKHLVKELDRRFIQLWDKIQYEKSKVVDKS